MALYISVTTASSELAESPINAAITRLAASVAGLNRQGMVPDGPSLDVTFMLPGKLDKPDFDGMRMGGYTPEGGILYFETAVPEHMLSSPEVGRYVDLVLQDVVTNAGDYFEDYRYENRQALQQAENTTFDKTSWQACIDQVINGYSTH